MGLEQENHSRDYLYGRLLAIAERIRARAREMLDKLWRGRGGFIAGFYSDERSIGLDPEWQAAASEEFVAHGVRSRYAEA